MALGTGGSNRSVYAEGVSMPQVTPMRGKSFATTASADARETRPVQRVRRRARAMAALPTEQRRVLELTYSECLSRREAAERLGCPTDTLKTRTFHARRRLRLLPADVANEAAA